MANKKSPAPKAPTGSKAKESAAVGSRKADKAVNGDRKKAELAKSPSKAPPKKASQPSSDAPAPQAKNPFTRQAKQEIQLHTTRSADQDALINRSFTIYRSDDQHIKELTEELNKYSRKKVNNSLVIRTAINHLRETIQKGGTRFEQDLERLIKDSI